MALTVGMPCGIASQLVLDGVLKTPGVHAPYSKEICDPIRVILEKEGLGLIEKALLKKERKKEREIKSASDNNRSRWPAVSTYFYTCNVAFNNEILYTDILAI
jgi:hypothetical protein